MLALLGGAPPVVIPVFLLALYLMGKAYEQRRTF